MRTAHLKPLMAAVLAAGLSTTAAPSLARSDPAPFPFDAAQLSGWWAESYNTNLACGPDNLRTTLQVDPVARRLEMKFDRQWQTALGPADHVGAKIVYASRRTLIIQYDHEKRLKKTGQPVEWELAVVAPGVYRWRDTEWQPGDVNTVVGIRCTN